jgi:hypothetical protein
MLHCVQCCCCACGRRDSQRRPPACPASNAWAHSASHTKHLISSSSRGNKTTFIAATARVSAATLRHAAARDSPSA